MADLTEVNMNVAALKRVDPYIKDILETATHVALYTFSADNNEWEKTDIEGALFVYSRSGEPYNSILIMNRLSTNNLVEPVTQGLDLQLQEPFLLYKNSKCNIYGIWFYDKDECIRIAAMLKQLVKDSDASRRTNVNSKSKKQLFNKNNATNNVDIFSMLSKAQENFNTNKTGGTTDKYEGQAAKSPRTTAETAGKFPNAAPANLGGLFDGSSQSVVDFFAKAKVNTGHFNHSVDHQQSPGNVHVPNENKQPLLLHRLMSHPAAHTLEHIEKQQRSITPQPVGIPSIQPPATVPISMNIMKNGTPKVKRQNKSTPHIESITTNSSINLETQNDNTSSFLRIQSPMTTQSTLVNHQTQSIFTNSGHSMTFNAMDVVSINHSDNTSMKSEVHRTLLNDTAIKSLPMTFSSLGINDKQQDDILSTPRSLVSTGQAPALIPPTMFSASSPSENSTRPQIEPLTKNQLLQAFNYLVKNDPEFMMKMHEAYVKSFNEILS